MKTKTTTKPTCAREQIAALRAAIDQLVDETAEGLLRNPAHVSEQGGVGTSTNVSGAGAALRAMVRANLIEAIRQASAETADPSWHLSSIRVRRTNRVSRGPALP